MVLQSDERGRGFTVLVPALPGCVTQGRTRDEALANAREAILGFVEGLEKAGEPLPTEGPPAELATVIM
ncbi:MAG TPA: type II toxin-antitoxin system HicB family antitoxin [Dehalococcoidia bacterium]|nr:type II toxin-antitoxin system HicB family antitoxin [Dehalococcoidia bacterium]